MGESAEIEKFVENSVWINAKEEPISNRSISVVARRQFEPVPVDSVKFRAAKRRISLGLRARYPRALSKWSVGPDSPRWSC